LQFSLTIHQVYLAMMTSTSKKCENCPSLRSHRKWHHAKCHLVLIQWSLKTCCPKVNIINLSSDSWRDEFDLIGSRWEPPGIFAGEINHLMIWKWGQRRSDTHQQAEPGNLREQQKGSLISILMNHSSFSAALQTLDHSHTSLSLSLHTLRLYNFCI